MKTINSRSDLNRLVAETVFCPEPPLSERRAIHESGAWLWIKDAPLTFEDVGSFKGHWQPADFCSDPAASYRLEAKMWYEGWRWAMRQGSGGWLVRVDGSKRNHFEASHADRRIAMCLVALKSEGDGFVNLAEGWDQR